MRWSQVGETILKFAKYRGSYQQATAWEGVWDDITWNSRVKKSLMAAIVSGMPPPTKKIRRALEKIVEESDLYTHFEFVQAAHEADYKVASLAMDAVEKGVEPVIISNDSDTTILALGTRKWVQSGRSVIQNAMTFWSTAYVSVRSVYRSLRSEGTIRELRAYIADFLNETGNEDLLALVGDGDNQFKWLDRHLCCVLIVLAAFISAYLRRRNDLRRRYQTPQHQRTGHQKYNAAAHDGEVLGRLAVVPQVVQRRQELTLGQVARGAKDDDEAIGLVAGFWHSDSRHARGVWGKQLDDEH